MYCILFLFIIYIIIIINKQTIQLSKSTKPVALHHLFLIAEDNIFAPPQSACMVHHDGGLPSWIALELNSTHSNFSKTAFFST